MTIAKPPAAFDTATDDQPMPAEVRALRDEILVKLAHSVGKDPIVAQPHDWLTAAILVVRDRVIDRWMTSTREAYQLNKKRVYYLSLEFLIGRLFRDTMGNLRITAAMRDALASLNVDMDRIAELEPDAALGNGGLGRLAACFMESMATVGIAAYGYGIRYEHGLFRQKIVDGWQAELPEDWLSFGNPWEFERREVAYEIGFGGTVTGETGGDGVLRHAWQPAEKVHAVAYDTPIVGWRGAKVNTLRLWRSRPIDPIELHTFNRGDHLAALAQRTRAESISQVLYPSDESDAGQELRLRQEFFFTSASLQDLVRRHVKQFGDARSLADKVAIQLNDTHPAIAVPELMRILMDLHGLTWEEAWEVTQAAIGYTNHTLLPEALESWPVPLLERMLPRHMQIIYAINAGTIALARAKNLGNESIASISLIDEHGGRRVRMGHLAFVGAHKINGVSALHSRLMRETIFRQLDQILPGRITNMTNGITPRRWLFDSNPALTALIRDAIGDSFLDNARSLADLVPLADSASFRDRFLAVKRKNKERLAKVVLETLSVKIDPSALFDVQIKRIHEYKRQLLNILETIALYDAMRAHPEREWVPRVKIFAGKAAASYTTAKYIIKLINDAAKVINADPATRGLLKVVFLPNYNVSLAEHIVPGADLSEQISTAGMEASGTGNMKLGLNGALTIGTLDGANVEIRDHVGEDNIFIFGLTAAEVEQRRREGYDPAAVIARSPRLAEVLDAVASGVFSPDDPDRYKGLVDNIRKYDWFMVAADFDAYYAAQRSVAELWRHRAEWAQKAVINTGNLGWFSSDRTIRGYADEIWGVQPTRPA
jgi:starch phosphorylase